MIIEQEAQSVIFPIESVPLMNFARPQSQKTDLIKFPTPKARGNGLLPRKTPREFEKICCPLSSG